MRVRVTTGIVMTVLAMSILYLRGVWILIAGTLLLLAAQYEVMMAFEKGGIKPYRALVFASGALIAPTIRFFGARAGLFVIFAALYLQSVSILLFRDFVFDRLLITLFSITYPAVPFLALFTMLTASGDTGFCCGVSAIFAAVGCDTFAWLIGRIWGKHKLCPAISPHKTVEGALGGVFGAFVGMLVIRHLLNLIGYTVSWTMVFLAAIFGSVASESGDLFASGLKRYCKIKDFGSILPGHGGVMDRIDGILFSACALFFVGLLINLF